MPIDPSQALGYEFEPAMASWSQDDVIRYHLGIGAGDPATDANELEVSVIGDALGYGPMHDAILEGHRVGRSI